MPKSFFPRYTENNSTEINCLQEVRAGACNDTSQLSISNWFKYIRFLQMTNIAIETQTLTASPKD